MGIRDVLNKCWSGVKDSQFKNRILTLYNRNMIVTLLRRSKINYYSFFFKQNQSNVKKNWDGIRNLINVAKKKNTPPTKLIYKNKENTCNIEMTE